MKDFQKGQEFIDGQSRRWQLIRVGKKGTEQSLVAEVSGDGSISPLPESVDVAWLEEWVRDGEIEAVN